VDLLLRIGGSLGDVDANAAAGAVMSQILLSLMYRKSH
jgi:hypothetical protein